MDCNAQHLGTAQLPNMTTRLANVIYWAGCVLALIWVAFMLCSMATNPINPVGLLGPTLFLTFGGAAVIWLIGRAIRYVMTGK